VKKFISLLSGGFDSPVASYLLIKKGLIPIFVSYLTFGNNNNLAKDQIVSIIQVLKKVFKSQCKLYFVEHNFNLETISRECIRKLTCVLCKRLMIQIAIRIGKIEKTNLIVTGDILGEQASQTINNLFAYNDLIKDIILLRPLIGWDKLDVINLNKKIGLYDICAQTLIACQHFPQYPETNAKSNELKESEDKLKKINLIETSLKNIEILEF